MDDAVHELSALIEQRPAIEKKGHQINYALNPVADNLLAALGALDCK